MKDTTLDYKKIVDQYLNINDWRVKENSTVTYSIGGLILSNSGAVSANYWLSEIYDEEIANAHRNADIHIHDLSMISGYCAGWSLKQLIKEGLGGVAGKISSAPASHLSTLCNQMVNFLGIMQNEWAGAQAFSSFDTYLAPFVKADNLTYKEVKQCIQSFIFGVNTPSRWGCCPITTKVATPNGFKSVDELKVGDVIYTWLNGTLHEAPLEHIIRRKNDYNVLHCYKGVNYVQTVTPEHRCLVETGTKRGKYAIRQSMDIFGKRSDLRMPMCIKDVNVAYNDNYSDDEIILAAMMYTDGSKDLNDIRITKSVIRDTGLICEVLDRLGLTYTVYERKESTNNHMIRTYRISDQHREYIQALIGDKYAINDDFCHLGREQSMLFIKTWAAFDGNASGRIACQYDNDDIRNSLELIMLRAGYVSHVWSRKKATDKNATNYLYAENRMSAVISEQEEIPYDGEVWCPNTKDGTAIYKDENGNIFISGNCQAPFTNITLDWTVPADMAELNCVVGGKEMPYKYKDCKAEMDMVNKAFLETMIEGDANGRGFQYPIPTYSITKNFDWSDTENNRLLFEMTAKYGTPYFSNYINSDMEPSDVRSMCPLTPDTEVVVKSNYGGIRVAPIKDIYRTHVNNDTNYKVWTGKEWCDGRPVRVEKTDIYEITFSNGLKVKLGKNHLQPTKDFGTLHADELKVGMWIPFNKNSYGQQNIGSYELGYVVGAYAGDGSHCDGSITYSLDAKEKDDDTESNIVKFWNSIGYTTHTLANTGNNTRSVRVNGNPYNIIQEYVFGENALEKGFTNKVFASSIEFKKGILDGFRDIDGSRLKKRIYTSSPVLRNHLGILLSSMGKKFTSTFEDNREGRYGDNANYTVAFPDRCSYGDYYTEDENYFYYKINDIEKVNHQCDYLYCFEIDNENHLFALANGMITHNCRLRLDLRELRKKSGGFFGSGESTGSVGVVTINMPRIAYLAEDEEDFYKKLDKMMDISARSLKIKRDTITKFLDDGLYPYTKRYLGTFNNHFSTIGLVGMNEAGLNAKWLQKDMTHEETQEFTKKVLNHMREKLSDYQELYGDLYNLEATPAESTSHRLAKHDKEKYPEIITASGDCGTPYYTNSSHLPVGFSSDIFDALDIQDELQTLYTSGTVFHAFLGEKLPTWQSAAALVRKIAENYKLPYYTISPTYSICKNHGYIVGEQYKCPICGEETEVYSRITGYYRPVKNWNDGKKQEFKDRLTYDIGIATKDEHIKSNNIDNGKEDTPTNIKDVILCVSKTCPNCEIAEKDLIQSNIPFQKIYAEDNPQKMRELKVFQAPTLVIINDNNDIRKFCGVSDIRKYIEN